MEDKKEAPRREDDAGQQSNTLYQYASEYAARGWRVFPLIARGKSPRVEGGFKAATAAYGQIAEWWGKWPDANIGIATGRASKLLVVDLDVDESKGEDGTATLRAWEREHGELPETATVNTGRGGTHLYYRYSGGDIGISTNAGLGVDIRCEGGYAVAPPSIHPNGTPYAWDAAPEDAGIADADGDVLAFVRYVQGGDAGRGGGKGPFELPEAVPEGARNDTLMRYASSLQSKGWADDEICAEVLKANDERCRPPMGEAEVLDIVRSVTGRYEKGEAPGRPRLLRKSNGAPYQYVENFGRVISGDPALRGRFYYDERGYTQMVAGPLPWDGREGDRPLQDSDYCGFVAYAERRFGLGGKEKAADAVTNATMSRRRNLVAEHLDSLEWDGVERIGALPARYLGADGDGYNAAVFRMFMLGTVARAYEPGAKFDYMLVLDGPQGIGKTSFARLLALKEEWFCYNLPTVGEKAAEKLRGKWIVELDELLASKKSKDVAEIKGFITAQADEYRVPYGKLSEQRPRACVLVGTCNEPFFLTDKTGNRRYLIIHCRGADPGAIFGGGAEEDVSQAWAEAVHIWKADRPRLVLDERTEARAEEQQEASMEDDPRVGRIRDYLDAAIEIERSKASPDLSRVRVSAPELIEDALDLDGSKIGDRRLVQDVHAIMNAMDGWDRYPANGGRARCGKYGIQRCYTPETGGGED